MSTIITVVFQTSADVRGRHSVDRIRRGLRALPGVADAGVFQLSGIVMVFGDAEMDVVMIRRRLRRLTGVSATLVSVGCC